MKIAHCKKLSTLLLISSFFLYTQTISAATSSVFSDLTPDTYNITTTQIAPTPTAATTVTNFKTSAAGGVITDNSAFYRYRGGTPYVSGASTPNDRSVRAVKNSQTGFADTRLTIEFMTDAPEFEFAVASGTGKYYTVFEEGQSVIKFITPAVNVAGAYWSYVKVPLATSGTDRLVRLHVNTGAKFRGAGVDTAYSLYAPTTEIEKELLIVGDSFTDGTGSNRYPFLLQISDHFPQYDFASNGIGGTGYLNPSSSATIPDRISADIAAFTDKSFDAIIALAGLNDYTLADAGGDLEGALNTFKTNVGSVPIFLANSFWSGDGSTKSAEFNSLNARISAWATINDSDVVYIGDPSDLSFTNTDGTHPDVDGHIAIGNWLMQALSETVPTETSSSASVSSSTNSSGMRRVTSPLTGDIGTVSEVKESLVDLLDNQGDIPTCVLEGPLNQRMKLGAVDGENHFYNRGVVTQVKTLQKALFGLGYFSDVIDGAFGEKTKSTLQEMQRDQGLEKVDGVFGPNSLIMVISKCS